MAMFPSSKATHLSLRFYCPILFESAIPLPLFQTSLEIAAMTHNFTACLLLLFTLLFMEQLAQLSVAHPIFCGEHVFDYPFGFKNSGHGDLSLQVKCDYGHRLAKPVLNISGKEYYILQPKVLNNFSFHHTMTIIDKELRDNCDPSSNNYTELRSSSQFHIAHTHIDITLWGQCNREWVDLPDQTASLKCNPDWHYNFTAAVSVPEACKAQAVLPVKNSGGPVDDHQIRHGGFPIKLNVSKSCRDCQSSGGCCGYYKSSMQFHCRCRRHRQYPDRCPAEKSSIVLPLGFSIGGVALVAAVILLLIYLKKRPYPRRGLPGDLGDYEKTELKAYPQQFVNLSIFSYEELKWAANFFNEKNKVGDGGFGSVYFGKLEDGRTVAVKKLYQQNWKSVEQFINEIKILSCLKHPNLVDLYGCSSPGSPFLLLVYEFMANGTLADHLHGNRRTSKGLPWETRLNIAVETAQALAFLHGLHPPILHRDVKSTNILLDENFRAKVADLGLCRLFPVNVSHVTTIPQGTPGYIDPNYHECFQLTDKSDVYSFGVVLVEIISAKVAVDTSRNRNEIMLAVMASDKIRRGVLGEILDPDLQIGMKEEVKLVVSAVAELAFRCLATDKDVRPDMKEVATRLEEIQEHQQSLA
ncbi:LEAF RUST 10 DISEASE-RESISTANCE LOCUS RECEPTOR-LIKE PROTEIN KINASE-like 1.2 [Cryptomeria japonica]|uniref:LEAF RUST 10 DISEASE-RESISTANCE LOCUS RECEPTOR-LIKE PROTEIN KINASE-like 1.2 n=1 Tax=Cryptomeria japonica TaxID=3369 RepID=UPI0027DA1B7B|nr:LEAF RUST 10 DISEASE-RESISTANCE LOCUS RECEPTOR-LIKE PROTEIN KINASE-like 1.2 [Cryptomeria japonica]